MSRLIALPILCLLALPATAFAASSSTAASAAAPVPKARSVKTQHHVTIDGKTIRYTATAGTIILRNDHNQPTGSMFYVAYTKDGVRNPADRPVTFLYNGGPGAASDWIQMGGLGPYRINTSNGSATPPAPYSITQSHDSMLNDSDLVFIDAMGTGYSHVVGQGKDKNFWGVDEDVKSFGQFIYRYLKENNRWQSPKFLYGESYGTTRSAALAGYLQNQGVALNGVVLQSTVLNYFDWAPGSDNKYIFDLPSYAAIAWYHDKVPNKPAKLAPFVQKAREFADGPYARALRQGDHLPAGRMDAMAQKLHRFTGLPVTYLERANLRVSPAHFRKELLLPQRKHLGRYDARFVGADASATTATGSFDPSGQYTGAAFTAAYEWYLHNVLKYHSNRIYKELSYKAYKHWDWKHDGKSKPYVAGDLASAMRKNPYLRVLSENGYFDMATPFHETEYDLDHVNLSTKLRKHITFTYFKSGHMIYLNPKALKAMHAALDTFYRNTLSADRKGGH